MRPNFIDQLTTGDYAKEFQNLGRPLFRHAYRKSDYAEISKVIERFETSGRMLSRATNLPKMDGFAKITEDHPFLYGATAHEKYRKYSHIAQIMIKVTPHTFFYSARSLPIFLNTAHIQGRHSDRAGDALHYGEAEFAELLATGLLLSHVAESHLQSIGQPRSRMIIPAKNGLYIGACHQFNPSILSKSRIMRIQRPFNRGPFIRHDQPPTWVPHVGIIISTYVNEKDLSQEHMTLHRLFKDILNSKNFDAVQTAAYANYLNGKSLIPSSCPRNERRKGGRAAAVSTLERAVKDVSIHTPSIQSQTSHSDEALPGGFLKKVYSELTEPEHFTQITDAFLDIFKSSVWAAYNEKHRGKWAEPRPVVPTPSQRSELNHATL